MYSAGGSEQSANSQVACMTLITSVSMAKSTKVVADVLSGK